SRRRHTRFDCDWSSDVCSSDLLLVVTRFASTNQLHLVEMPMVARTQITFGDEPITTARFQPGDPNVIWYLQDKGGGEFFQVFRLDRKSVVEGKSVEIGGGSMSE